MAVCYFIIWLYGGIVYTSLAQRRLSAARHPHLLFIGWVSCSPTCRCTGNRKKVEDPKYADEVPDATAPAAGE